jgi:hypothetical protein
MGATVGAKHEMVNAAGPNWGPRTGMARHAMALSDIAIRNAKPRPKPFKLGDSMGLFLLIQPSGGKLWRLNCRIEGREKKLAIGTCPETGLSDARKRRDEACELIALGKARRATSNATRPVRGSRLATPSPPSPPSFATSVSGKRTRAGRQAPPAAANPSYPGLPGRQGEMPLNEIEPADLLVAVRRIEAKGNLESALRTLQLASAVSR